MLRCLEAMKLQELKLEIKRLIIQELDIRDRTESEIGDDEPLFGDGLGLDSLDALQLAMALEERFGVQIPEGDEAHAIFASVSAIAEHLAGSG
jgi:acyl carrier protein